MNKTRLRMVIICFKTKFWFITLKKRFTMFGLCYSYSHVTGTQGLKEGDNA